MSIKPVKKPEFSAFKSHFISVSDKYRLSRYLDLVRVYKEDGKVLAVRMKAFCHFILSLYAMHVEQDD